MDGVAEWYFECLCPCHVWPLWIGPDDCVAPVSPLLPLDGGCVPGCSVTVRGLFHSLSDGLTRLPVLSVAEGGFLPTADAAESAVGAGGVAGCATASVGTPARVASTQMELKWIFMMFPFLRNADRYEFQQAACKKVAQVSACATRGHASWRTGRRMRRFDRSVRTPVDATPRRIVMDG